MPFGYGYNPLDAIFSGFFTLLGALATPFIVYWIVTFIAYIFTPVEALTRH